MECVFTGELDPNFHWSTFQGDITGQTPYRIAESGSKKSTLSIIDSSTYNKVERFTCKVTFSGIEESLQTSTYLHFRGSNINMISAGNV